VKGFRMKQTWVARNDIWDVMNILGYSMFKAKRELCSSIGSVLFADPLDSKPLHLSESKNGSYAFVCLTIHESKSTFVTTATGFGNASRP